MKLSEMKEILARKEILLTKTLGQNFLHDANQLRRIMAAADLTDQDRVLEVGPGLGPLTELLLARAARVLAIEKDRRLFALLQERFRTATNLELLQDDALVYLRSRHADWSDWKLVSNLPYSVASPILVEMAQAKKGPRRIVVTLQLEVARRLMARSGEKDYGLLTLLVQLSYEPGPWFKIPASCFFPQPEVDSACITLIRRAIQPLDDRQSETFTRIVKRGFSQRRKMMFKLLEEDWRSDLLETAFQKIPLSAKVRAEGVSLEEFVKLSALLHSSEGRRDALPCVE